MKIEHSEVNTPRGVVDVYKVTNSSGASVVLSSLGAGIVEVNVPDTHGRIENVALCYANISDYIADGPCMGKTPGRYANRIAEGKFTIDAHAYELVVNNGPNHLHGGPEGFQNRIWKSSIVKQCDDHATIKFFRLSPDGEENYPGNLNVSVEYTWTEDNVLTIKYEAETDKPTPINLTNHAYWNLRAWNAGSALNHWLRLNADFYLTTDQFLTPTGEIAPVASTPMDFTKDKRISEDINKSFPALEYGKGYDNCWVVNNYEKGTLHHAATLRCEITGRTLDVYTTQPGVQIYSGNWLKGCPTGPDGFEYDDYYGIAIECQHFPDSPNHPSFPSTILRPGEKYEDTTVLRFTAESDV